MQTSSRFYNHTHYAIVRIHDSPRLNYACACVPLMHSIVSSRTGLRGHVQYEIIICGMGDNHYSICDVKGIVCASRVEHAVGTTLSPVRSSSDRHATSLGV